jgi:hypothetical protein
MFLLTTLLAGAGLLGAADQSQDDEIAHLKATLVEQQKQLQTLQQTLQNQQALLEKALGAGNFNSIGQVASTSPMIPKVVAPLPIAYPAPAIAQPLPQGSTAASGNPCESQESPGPIPAYLRLGDVCITPIGFMDLTPVFRDKNAGSSMGSNFGSIPFNNTANGNLSEERFSIQNSRLGLRVDGDWKGAHFIGYNEFDFNGTSGSASLAVSNGAVVPRLRLFWVDVAKGKWEFLGGQSWSMLTPNRNGISALPGDLFYTQVIDINYMAGLTWTRQPGVRVLFHPDEHLTFGFSAEQPDQYIGGSGGGSSAVLPAALVALSGAQLDGGFNLGSCNYNGSTCTGQSYLAQPTVTPDFIVKMAIDFSRVHFEVAGIESNFRTALNLSTAGAVSIASPYNLHPITKGGGLQFGANLALLKNFRLITTNFITEGDGRYLFGQAPDIVVNANGSLTPLHAGGTIDGFEATVKNTLFYAYYGGIYVGRDVVIDANGTSLVGYGYHGSSNSQNRAINEITFGFNQTMWRDPRYGAINFMGQYEWLERAPWYVAAGSPKETHDSTIYFDVRYTLPGAMPKF